MHNKAHCYWYKAPLCCLGMSLYKLCAQRVHNARAARNMPPKMVLELRTKGKQV